MGAWPGYQLPWAPRRSLPPCRPPGPTRPAASPRRLCFPLVRSLENQGIRHVLTQQSRNRPDVLGLRTECRLRGQREGVPRAAGGWDVPSAPSPVSPSGCLAWAAVASTVPSPCWSGHTGSAACILGSGVWAASGARNRMGTWVGPLGSWLCARTCALMCTGICASTHMFRRVRMRVRMFRQHCLCWERNAQCPPPSGQPALRDPGSRGPVDTARHSSRGNGAGACQAGVGGDLRCWHLFLALVFLVFGPAEPEAALGHGRPVWIRGNERGWKRGSRSRLICAD